MAQNITLLGASYSDVPSVELPKTGGGTAQFDDTAIASNAAAASDIAQGKLAYVNGSLVTGTASGGGATLITKSITANGTYNASSDNADGYSSVTVNVSGGGGGGGDMSDPIRFFDYDGTLVASYSAVPSSLPSVPTHTGLKNGTWNYTLQEVTTQFNAMGSCDVGANYDTVSGATEIDIKLVDPMMLSPYLRFAVNGEITVDWGDNSTSTSTGTSLTTRKNLQHEYQSVGEYTIKITLTSGTKYSMYGTNTYPLLHVNSSTASDNVVYSKCVKSIRIGANCDLGSYAFSDLSRVESICLPPSGLVSMASARFSGCRNLRHITIPPTVTSSVGYINQSYGLRSVSIPLSVTQLGDYFISANNFIDRYTVPVGINTIGSYAFGSCYAHMIDIPNSVTNIKSYAFQLNVNITSITVPSSVTTIGTSAFTGCKFVKEYHIKPTTPPTLGTTAFSNIASDCIIYVPSAKLNDYKTAENWSVYAGYMQGE